MNIEDEEVILQRMTDLVKVSNHVKSIAKPQWGQGVTLHSSGKNKEY